MGVIINIIAPYLSLILTIILMQVKGDRLLPSPAGEIGHVELGEIVVVVVFNWRCSAHWKLREVV